jgi:hypothetical protein
VLPLALVLPHIEELNKALLFRRRWLGKVEISIRSEYIDLTLLEIVF